MFCDNWLVLHWIVTERLAIALVARMSMPRVLRREMDAMWPRRESSAATKYSPATPASRDGILVSACLAFIGWRVGPVYGVVTSKAEQAQMAVNAHILQLLECVRNL